MDKIDSVLSLRVTKAVYKADRPYINPNDKETSGSGFIIDIEKGLVVTNAHVVANAISITGRLSKTGRRDLSLELIGICREKDVAVCKLSNEDIALIKGGLSAEDISKINLKFGDSMAVNLGDSVITLGYPLDSDNIKITTGVVAGFEIVNNDENYNLNEVEDSYLRSPSYIQISAAITYGNSGGPLLNSKHQVIGINSGGLPDESNIGYAIPSRTFLSVYGELLRGAVSESKVVKMPTLGLEWCKTNRELMKKQTGSSSTYGIYVRKVYPDTCFDLLEKGDIIRRIDYIDIFWAGNFDINNLDKSLTESLNYKKKAEDEIAIMKNQIGELVKQSEESKIPLDQKKVKEIQDKILAKYSKMNYVTIFLDRYGMSIKIGKLKNPDEVDESKIEFEKIYTERKLDLSEIMDMIPIGTDISLNISRNLNWYMLKSKYIYVDRNERVPHVYPRLNKTKSYDYEIFAGICVMNLDVSHFDIFKNLDCYSQNVDNRYKNQVIIVQVFPESSASKTQVLKSGHLIKTILGFNVSFELMNETNRLITSLEDVRYILSLKPEQLQITTTDESTFFIPVATIVKEDKNILSNYNILSSNR